jgi:hypothetical protein
MRTRTLVVGFIVSSIAPLGINASTHPAVQPGQDFSNPTLQVHAPTSDGWFESAQTGDRIAFGKSGSERDESYIATVILFHIPEFTDTDAFTTLIKQGIEKDTPADRFETLGSVVQYSTERTYPCVRHHGTAIDKKSRASGFLRKSLRLEVISLYCQHPYRPNLGFMASFSHRGGADDPYFAGDAEKFINAIQATPKSSAPAQQ